MLKIKYIVPVLALALSAVAALFFAACQPEDLNSDLPKGAIRLVADGFKATGGAKLGVDDEGAQVYFIEGDEVWVNGTTYTVRISGGVPYISLPDDVEYPLRAVYPASLVQSYSGGNTVDIQFPDEYDYRVYKANGTTRRQNVAAPLCAYAENNNDGNRLVFQHLTAAIVVAFKNTTKIPIIITSLNLRNSGQVMYRRMTIDVSNPVVGYEPEGGDNTGDNTGVTIAYNFPDSCIVGANSVGYIQIPILPVGETTSGGSQFTIDLTATPAMDGVPPFEFKFNKTQTGSNLTINRSQMAYAPIILASNATGNGDYEHFTQNGFFSIADGKQVYFSKGNLKYKVPGDGETENEVYYSDTSHWGFCDSQHEYIETRTGSETISDSESDRKYSGRDGWTGLFVYGSNGKKEVYPRATAHSVPGLANNWIEDNLRATNPVTDWGVRVGDGKWFTLTKDEWDYLLSQRQMSVNGSQRWVTARLNDVKGLFIYPDKYWSGVGATAIGSGNNVSLQDWENNFQKRGVVFLPAAGNVTLSKQGNRYRLNFANIGKYCEYWTATATTEKDKHYLLVNYSVSPGDPGTENSKESSTQHFLRSVRLVHPANF